MLQRKYFPPKWHLDWTSSSRNNSAYRPTFFLTRHISTPVEPKILSPSLTSNNRPHATSLPKGIKTHAIEAYDSLKEVYSISKDLLSDKSLAEVLESIKSSPKLLSFFSNPSRLCSFVNTLAKSSNPAQSLQFLKLAYDLGLTLGHSIYESVCYHLWATKQWDCILAVTLYAKRHNGYTSVKLLNWRATALMETGQFSLLQGILEEFKATSLCPNQFTYHLLMTGCIRNNDLEGSKRCLRDMKEAGFTTNATTHAIISKSYWQFGADAQVRQSAMESLPELQPRERIIVMNNLLQFSLAQHDLKTVSRLLSMFDPTSTQPLISLVSSGAGNHDSTPLVQPKIGKTEPNADTYAIFMNYQSRVENPTMAMHLWKMAAAVGLSATPNVIAALIHALFLQGHGDTATRMVAGISCQSPANHFQSLLIDPSNQEDPPPLNLPPSSLTTRTCNVLLKAVLKRQGLAAVPAMFAIMHSNHLTPNDRTLELILSHLNHTQEPRPRTLFQIARKLAPMDQPSSRHMHNILSCILRDEKRLFIDSAWKMRLKGPRPVKERRRRVRLLQHADNFDPIAGLGLTEHLSYDKMARPILHSLSNRQVKIDSATTFLRMRRDAMLHLDVDSAIDVFRSMLARGLRPTPHHFCALVEGYALSGDFASANKVMLAAKEVNITPNIVMYTILIAAHARHRDSTSAMQVFNEMVSAGIRPDVPSIDALISAFYAGNDRQTARQLLIKLWPSVQPFPETLQTADLATLIAHFRTLHPYCSRGVPFKKPQRIAVYAQIKRLMEAHQQYFGPRRDLTEQDKEDGIRGK